MHEKTARPTAFCIIRGGIFFVTYVGVVDSAVFSLVCSVCPVSCDRKPSTASVSPSPSQATPAVALTAERLDDPGGLVAFPVEACRPVCFSAVAGGRCSHRCRRGAVSVDGGHNLLCPSKDLVERTGRCLCRGRGWGRSRNRPGRRRGAVSRPVPRREQGREAMHGEFGLPRCREQLFLTRRLTPSGGCVVSLDGSKSTCCGWRDGREGEPKQANRVPSPFSFRPSQA